MLLRLKKVEIFSIHPGAVLYKIFHRGAGFYILLRLCIIVFLYLCTLI